MTSPLALVAALSAVFVGLTDAKCANVKYGSCSRAGCCPTDFFCNSFIGQCLPVNAVFQAGVKRQLWREQPHGSLQSHVLIQQVLRLLHQDPRLCELHLCPRYLSQQLLDVLPHELIHGLVSLSRSCFGSAGARLCLKSNME